MLEDDLYVAEEPKYVLCFIHYKGVESCNLTQIDATALVMHLTSTLSLILDFKDEKI